MVHSKTARLREVGERREAEVQAWRTSGGFDEGEAEATESGATLTPVGMSALFPTKPDPIYIGWGVPSFVRRWLCSNAIG